MIRSEATNTTELSPEQWVDNYGDQLFRYTILRISDRQQAEDLVQDTFLSAWKSRHSFNGTNERAWLFAICKNKIIDHYRATSAGANISLDHYFDDEDHWTNGAKPRPWNLPHREIEAGHSGHSDFFGQSAFSHHSDYPGHAHDEIARIDSADFYKILNACRNKLNSLQFAVFTLKYLDQLETKEICQKLNITVQNYWVLIHRAKLQLRECLQLNWLNLK